MASSVRITHDLKLIYTMDRMCFPDDEPYRYASAKWWVARRNGAAAGYAGAKVLLGSSAVYLCRAGVLPQHRGNGVQRDLIKARIRWARRLDGVSYVLTDTIPRNPASANNLIAAGFRLFDPENPWTDGADCLYWRLEL